MNPGRTRRKKKKQSESDLKQFEKLKNEGKKSTGRWKKNEKK